MTTPRTRTLLTTLLLVSTSLGPVRAEPPQPYAGDAASLRAFALRHGLDHWPMPQTLAYADPAGTSAPVLRYAHWRPTRPEPIGTVVHFNGRTEFIERNMRLYRDLLMRGYEVWSFDWRGQGMSQRQIADKQRHSIDDFDTYVRDATYLVENVVRIRQAPGVKVLLAHSMGGQIALRYLESEGGQGAFDRAVLSSPMLRVPGDNGLVRVGNRLKIWFGLGERCVLNKSPTWASDFAGDVCQRVRPPSASPEALIDAQVTARYSHDWQALADTDCLVTASQDARGPEAPDLRVACPTSTWLHAAFASTDQVMTEHARLRTPTLIVRALPDKIVDNDGQTEFCHLTGIRCVDIGQVEGVQAGHELLLEAEPIRRRVLREFDAFVQEHRGRLD
jgi:lysophospholipase